MNGPGFYKSVWKHGYSAGQKAWSAYSIEHDSRLFMDERFRAAEQALANSGYDLDMFDRQLLRLAFQCGWSDAEFDE